MTGERRGRALAWKAALGLLVTGAFFRVLFEYVDLADVGGLFASLRWGPWIAGAGLWMGVYAVRTARFRRLAPRTRPATMFWITAVHTLLLRLLPFRTGELSYGLLVRRAGTAGLGESLLGLLLLRIMDATAVMLVFIATLLAFGGAYLGDRGFGLVAAAAAGVAGAAGILLLPRLLRGLSAVLRRGAGALGSRAAAARSLLVRGEAVVASLEAVGPRTLVVLGALSVLQWLLTFAAFYAILAAFSVPVGPARTVLGATAAVVSGVLPIGGIGSFGTLEAGWALGFVLVGLDEGTAVATGFGVSLSTLAWSILPGVAGWILLGRGAPRGGPA
ncbi:MAG: flippase-like domain-containing protein [Deltaproteobacteria bacterium]|nr:flippase-like domain-containing protein [Deltaproteobacteria bacterium]